jgi:oligopeptide transport system ATP-binding protein
MNDVILDVQNLAVRFTTPDGTVQAVSELTFSLAKGETLAIVGESGSGKSQTMLAMMGLLARNGVTSGQVHFLGQNLLTLSPRELDQVRGRQASMVFQDPMTALNPALRLSRQLTETLEVHEGLSAAAARERALAMLDQVGIPDPSRRFEQYPHELSGGMRQRVMIAIGLLCQPALLIADEPTTALDVTIQAQILDLFADLTHMGHTGLILITHDMGVVAQLADRVLVMYGGRMVEQGPVDAIFDAPAHPYTQALLASTPRIDRTGHGIEPIPGRPPNLLRLPPGCAFAPRCRFVGAACKTAVPSLATVGTARLARCNWPLITEGAA